MKKKQRLQIVRAEIRGKATGKRVANCRGVILQYEILERSFTTDISKL